MSERPFDFFDGDTEYGECICCKANGVVTRGLDATIDLAGAPNNVSASMSEGCIYQCNVCGYTWQETHIDIEADTKSHVAQVVHDITPTFLPGQSIRHNDGRIAPPLIAIAQEDPVLPKSSVDLDGWDRYYAVQATHRRPSKQPVSRDDFLNALHGRFHVRRSIISN